MVVIVDIVGEDTDPENVLHIVTDVDHLNHFEKCCRLKEIKVETHNSREYYIETRGR